MRMLALVTDAFGGRGGIAQANRDLLTSFVETDPSHETVVVPRQSPDGAGPLPARIAQAEAQPSKPRYALRAWRTARAGGKWDVIWCGHLHLLPLAAWLSRSRQARLWLHLYGIEAWRPLGGAYRRLAGRADWISAASRYTRERFADWTGVSPSRIRVLPAAVDERYGPGPKSAELARRWSVDGRRVILTVSRLSTNERYKGHERVFAALGRLLEMGQDWVYVVTGDGDDRPRLERLARESGVGDRVRFVGWVDETLKQEAYRLADVFVMPSTHEGFGIVYLEAARSGAPVVAGDGDGSRDPLRDGLVGRLIPAQDVESLARAISESYGRSTASSTEAAGVFLRRRQREHLRLLLDEWRKP